MYSEIGQFNFVQSVRFVFITKQLEKSANILIGGGIRKSNEVFLGKSSPSQDDQGRSRATRKEFVFLINVFNYQHLH